MNLTHVKHEKILLKAHPQFNEVWLRDRIEMITLADAGWSAPRIAAHLGHCGQAVRDLLKGFLARGTDALHPRRPGPPPDDAYCGRLAEELGRCLADDRTWTSRQLGEDPAGRGIRMGSRQVRRHHNRMRARYRRAASTLDHKQDPDEADRAGRVLAHLKARLAAGSVALTTSTSAASRRLCRSATAGAFPVGGGSSDTRPREAGE